MSITDMLTVAEFYGQDVWGTPYGAGHRGFDIERAASRPVPHLFPGTVVRRSSNSELGGFVVTDRGAGVRGRYIGYGHTVGGSGNALGHVAGYDENHGSKWSAPHTHLSVSDSPYGIDTPSVATYDPLPFIIDAISGFAAGTGTVIIPEQKEDALSLIAVSTNRSTDWVIPAPGLAFMIPDSGPLRLMSADEMGAYDFWSAHGIPYRRAEWEGNQIRLLTQSRGLELWEGFPAIPANLSPVGTGKVFRGDWKTADYPRVSNVGFGSGGAPSSSTEILAKLAALGDNDDANAAQIVALIGKVPDAVADESADRLDGVNDGK